MFVSWGQGRETLDSLSREMSPEAFHYTDMTHNKDAV